MNYWLVIASPDKWFCGKCRENAKVNDELLNLNIQSWRVKESYFRNAKIGDKCIIKIGNDTRSIERRTLKNGEVVDLLESGIYAVAEIFKPLYIDEEGIDRIQIKVTKNLFKDNILINREMAEKVLGRDYRSLSSKKLDKEKYNKVLSLIEIEEDSEIDYDLEIDNLENEESSIYPVEVKIQRDMYSVRELKTDYEDKMLILAPDFQRESVWSIKQKSELVESILMGIPLPMVYFFEGDNGVIQVVDGKQRLTALFEFLDNKYPLSYSLSILSHLRGLKYRDLKPAERTKIARHQFVAQTIIPPTPDRIKFDIFERVNRKGSKLSNQEMRNALYQGKATELLNRLALKESFLKATNYSVSSTRMRDRHMILRFLAFYLWKKRLLKDKNGNLIDYRSDIDEFLGKTMEFINRQEDKFIEKLTLIFEETMKLAFLIRNESAFIIPNKKRKRINMALMESLSYLFSQIRNSNNSLEYRDKIDNLLKDNEYIRALTQRVDSTRSVEMRFKKIDEVLNK